jgi:hypothetical protein
MMGQKRFAGQNRTTKTGKARKSKEEIGLLLLRI